MLDAKAWLKQFGAKEENVKYVCHFGGTHLIKRNTSVKTHVDAAQHNTT
jgi:hypothetical protein